MTGLITRTWTTQDGTTMAVFKTDDRKEVHVPVFGAREGLRVRLVDGVWMIARAA